MPSVRPRWASSSVPDWLDQTRGRCHASGAVLLVGKGKTVLVSDMELVGDLALLTWVAEGDTDETASQAERAYRAFDATLRASGAVILQERIFGRLSAAADVLAARGRATAGSGDAWAVPPTYVEGDPVGGTPRLLGHPPARRAKRIEPAGAGRWADGRQNSRGTRRPTAWTVGCGTGVVGAERARRRCGDGRGRRGDRACCSRPRGSRTARSFAPGITSATSWVVRPVQRRAERGLPSYGPDRARTATGRSRPARASADVARAVTGARSTCLPPARPTGAPSRWPACTTAGRTRRRSTGRPSRAAWR